MVAYCWKHKLSAPQGVEVIDTGLLYRMGGFRMFFNAKVKIMGVLHVGRILTVGKSSDYIEAGEIMQKDGNFILVVAEQCDTERSINFAEYSVPVVTMEIPQIIEDSVNELVYEDKDHRACWTNVRENVSRLIRHSWLAALQTERLENMVAETEETAKQCQGSYSLVFYRRLEKLEGIRFSQGNFPWNDNILFGFKEASKLCRFLREYIKHGNGMRLNTRKMTDVVVNAYLPAAFAYGKARNKESVCDAVFEITDCMGPEDTAAVRTFRKYGIKAIAAGDSMALNQLRGYCDKGNCLNCRFCLEYIKNKLKKG